MEKDKVLEFIERRFNKDSDWCNGNCLWFALILSQRFWEATIYYLPIRGHFITKINEHYYDWEGIVDITNETPISFKELRDDDPSQYNHLIRDCFN